MKLNVWILSALAPLTAVAVLAQDTTPTPPAAPPATNAPAPAPAPETAPAAPKKKASSVKKRVVLTPPASATVKGTVVNVRGQASFTGEVLGRLQKGDAVTVLEQITLHPQEGEPAQWSKIAMPAGIPVWIDGDYIATDTKTVKARRVNLRGGPGENYSVVGRLEKGAEVKEIRSEKGWVAIEAPTNAYAYVAADLLEIQPAPAAVAVAPVPSPAPVAPAPEAPQVVNVTTPAAPVAATNEPAVAAPPAPAPTQQSEIEQELDALHRATAAAAAPVPASEPAVPAAAAAPGPAGTNEAAPPRIVTREGFVHRAHNIQAPADFELHDIQSGKLIDYLQPKPGQNFKMYVGTRVTVTGPEGVTTRWGRTPVLEVQSVDLMP
jgi:uncharacterized protein YgiM (DUF1202 family)